MSRLVAVAASCCAVLLLAAPARAGITTDFSSPLKDPHIFGASALLSNGHFLVAGGADDAVAIATAESYDQATGAWTYTLPMATARQHFSLTALGSGQALATGGESDAAERYDSATNAWAPAGTMSARRPQSTAVRLAGGKVLVIGGFDDQGAPRASAEVWDPVTNTFSPTGGMGSGRVGSQAILLPNGNVLAAGGADAGGMTPSAELYSPATNSWAPTGAMTVPRGSGVIQLLPNGKVLVATGMLTLDQNTAATTTTNLYDIATGSWADGPATLSQHFGGAMAQLPGGDPLLAGGGSVTLGVFDNDNGRALEEYDVANNVWVDRGQMRAPRFYDFATALPSGKVLIAGGTGLSGVELRSELYRADAKVHALDAAFGDVVAGRSGQGALVQVRNTGDTVLTTTGVTVTGPNAGDFAVDGSDCTVADLQAGDHCLVAVTFTPGAAGNRTATLQIAGNIVGGPATAALHGTGVTGIGSAGPVGPVGPVGPAGPAGPTGPRGKVTVKCKLIVKKVKGVKKPSVTCRVKSARAARLTRRGTVYARGTARRLTAVRALRPGRYLLRVGSLRLAVDLTR